MAICESNPLKFGLIEPFSTIADKRLCSYVGYVVLKVILYC